MTYASVLLPEPLGPMRACDLALVDRQIDALENLPTVDFRVQILDFEHRRCQT